TQEGDLQVHPVGEEVDRPAAEVGEGGRHEEGLGRVAVVESEEGRLGDPGEALGAVDRKERAEGPEQGLEKNLPGPAELGGEAGQRRGEGGLRAHASMLPDRGDQAVAGRRREGYTGEPKTQTAAPCCRRLSRGHGIRSYGLELEDRADSLHVTGVAGYEHDSSLPAAPGEEDVEGEAPRHRREIEPALFAQLRERQAESFPRRPRGGDDAATADEGAQDLF